MTRRDFLRSSVLAASGICLGSKVWSAPGNLKSTDHPNIVLIVSDDQGYATAVIGKWHVGIEPEYRPLKRGFDEFYGFLGHGAHDYFKLQITNEHNSIYRNDKPINDTGYLTDNLAVREGKWKLLFRKGSLELYNLQADIGEKNNLVKQNPEIVKHLQRAYQAWKNQMAPQLSKARRGRQTPDAISSKKRKNRRNR